MENFAKRVKARRKELGLSQEEVATLSGLKQPDVSKIELGKRKVTTLQPPSSAVVRLSDWLQRS